jgi:hypothetical protein
MKSVVILKKIRPEILMNLHVLRPPEYEKSGFWSAVCLCMDICVCIIGLYRMNNISASELEAI